MSVSYTLVMATKWSPFPYRTTLVSTDSVGGEEQFDCLANVWIDSVSEVNIAGVPLKVALLIIMQLVYLL